MTTRYSLKADIQKQIKYLEAEHGFDCTDGYNQVRNRPIDVIVAYGRYSAYLDLLDRG